MNNKGQYIILGTMVMLLIFLLAFSLYLDYILNDPTTGDFSDVQRESVRLSDILLEQGFPADWNVDVDTVTRIGLMDEHNILDKDTVDEYYNIARDNYFDSKLLTGIENDYLVLIDDKAISGEGFPETEDEVLSNYDVVAVQKRFLQTRVHGTLKTINMRVYVFK